MRTGPNAPAILDALGDPVRRLIFERLRREPRSATELAKTVPVTRSAVARHIGVLRDAGLVSGAREGVRVVYEVREEGLAPLSAWIG